MARNTTEVTTSEKQIVAFKAKDGTLFESLEDCEKHDSGNKALMELKTLLNDKGWSGMYLKDIEAMLIADSAAFSDILYELSQSRG